MDGVLASLGATWEEGPLVTFLELPMRLLGVPHAQAPPWCPRSPWLAPPHPGPGPAVLLSDKLSWTLRPQNLLLEVLTPRI